MPTSSARLKYCGASVSSNLPQPRRPLAPHELPPRQMRLTIRPERPSGPYFTSSTLFLSGAQNIRRNGLVDTAQRTLHAIVPPYENALEHTANQRIIERDVGRRAVDSRERLALLGRGRAGVVGDMAQLEGGALGAVDLEARDTDERARRRRRGRHLNRLVLEVGKG